MSEEFILDDSFALDWCFEDAATARSESIHLTRDQGVSVAGNTRVAYSHRWHFRRMLIRLNIGFFSRTLYNKESRTTMKALAPTKLRPRRREIPDPQVRDAADQFETARQLLDAQPPGSGMLCPLMNNAAVAIELYLKCLSAEKECADAERGWSIVSVTRQFGHGLTALLDRIEGDLKDELDRAFLAEFPASWGSFRAALEQCEGAFETSRYPFELGRDVSKFPMDILMGCSHFLQQFVSKLHTTGTIQWSDQEPQRARPQGQR